MGSSAWAYPFTIFKKKEAKRLKYPAVTTLTPFPTKALFASFHSGLCVFNQIPASGIKLDTLVKKVTNNLSDSVARRGAMC